ncbi:hypothetical protein NHP190003_13530 [Helicobacter sp. NHP19-003]|uniref:Host-nuclease inhibitor protein Gam n=1 Tax=Helicobacter gastrocanis TaxID=2849641 RepID=A0ABM7SDJ5_9HELI|nr:host-nuclease inhibitor Gam family protein [Helicobacter sp. NHP19-003]BCZ18071.1 hypothetical protein NHP190003_13530 [Helicobacter sp. NHP19-003]
MAIKQQLNEKLRDLRNLEFGLDVKKRLLAATKAQVDEKLEEIAALKAEIQELAQSAPELFGKKKSLNLEEGSIKFTTTTALEYDKELEDIIIEELKAMGYGHCVCTSEKLVLKAVGNLPPLVLEKLGIVQVKKENCAITPA